MDEGQQVMLDLNYKFMKKKQLIAIPRGQLLKKTLRIMRLTLILMLAFIFDVNALGFSQVVRVSVHCQNELLSKVFKDLENQTDYYFFFNDKNVNTDQRVTLSIQEEELEKALQKIIGDGYQYEISNNLIIITKAKIAAQLKAGVEKKRFTGVVRDSKGESIPGVSVVVKGTTTGTATDLDGKFTIDCPSDKPMILVFSFVGMKSKEVTATPDKPLSIVLEDDAQVLEDVVVTGYRSISKTTFTGSSTKLQQEDIAQKGVVDVSRMLEGQVAGVSIQNVSGTFGAAPKVRVRGATSLSGENKPLWVIDGVVHEDIVSVSNDELTSGDPTTLLGSAVAGLNANDIESIDILKDAAATALYGARAMNGVVVVTTKKGVEGRPILRYSGNFTVQFRPTYADYDILNSGDQMSIYAELERKGFLNSDLVNDANSGVYGKMYKLINTYDPETGEFGLLNTVEARRQFLRRYANANTDWFKVLFRNSLQQEHSISISAGNQKSRTYGSLSFLNDEGWSIGTKVRRYTANIRNDLKLADNLNLGLQVIGCVRDQKAPGALSRRSNTVEGTYDRDFDINPFSYALNTSRAMTCYDEDGNLEFFTRNYAPFNIIHELRNNSIHLKMVDVKAQVDLGWEIVKGLRYEFTGAVRYVKSDREHMIKEKSNMAEAYRADYNSTIRKNNNFLYKDPDHPEAEPVSVLPYGGFYNRTEDQLTSYDVRNSLKFNKKFGLHELNMIGGIQVKYADRQAFNNTGYGYQYEEGGNVSVDYRIMKMMIESNFPYYGMGTTRDRFVAFYYNADYGYDARYIFSGTVRYDGTNALGKSRTARWLPTWNVSAKWNISNEHFMEPVKWVDQLSLRASYGLTASMNSSASASAKFVDGTTNRPTAGDHESVITMDALENKDLTWEKGHVLNLGIDLGLFNRRLDVIFDYWKRNSFDLIATMKTSGIGGKISKKANYADMESSGFDIAIGITPIRTKDWGWKSNFTLGYTKTKITNSKNLPSINNMIRSTGGNLEGYPVGSLFSIQFCGLTPDTGVPLILDQNGEVAETIDFQSTNLQYLKYEGPVDPTYTGGWSNTFRWKDLSVNVFLTFQAGNKVRLDGQFKKRYTELDAMSKVFKDRWMHPGDEKYTNVPSIPDAMTVSRLSSKYAYSAYNYTGLRVAKGDFVRLKTISLTYRLPKYILEKTRILSDMTLTVAGSNLWLIYADKKFNGQDPEFYNTGGVAQPLARQFTVALNIGF